MVKKKEDNKSLYIDVTKELLDKATPNSHDILIDKEFIDDKNVRHPIKDIEKVHPASKNSDEYMIASILKETLGGEIHMVPRITNMANSHLGVKTPDYIWNNEKWDLKTPRNVGHFKNTIERFLKKKNARIQAEKYIINYINFDNITNQQIINVVHRTLKNRNWVKCIIIIRNRKIFRIYSKIK